MDTLPERARGIMACGPGAAVMEQGLAHGVNRHFTTAVRTLSHCRYGRCPAEGLDVANPPMKIQEQSMSDDTCNVGAPDRDRIHVNEADAP